ncbi:MAG TPA: hypothetical protein VFZ65_11010 [Planctomycetota bacterium]|nr:hypothetical protein [Planctomycetota bacterium]
MVTTFVGMFLGLVLGTLVAGPAGGVLGIMIGGVSGMLWSTGSSAVLRARQGARLVREQQRLLCMPKGQVAMATFVRDAQNGQWLDVERCSLCTPEGEVGCEKRCLLLMRDTLPGRTHPVERRQPATA